MVQRVRSAVNASTLRALETVEVRANTSEYFLQKGDHSAPRKVNCNGKLCKKADIKNRSL